MVLAFSKRTALVKPQLKSRECTLIDSFAHAVIKRLQLPEALKENCISIVNANYENEVTV